MSANLSAGFDVTQAPNGSACGINLRFTHAFLPPVFMVLFAAGTLSNAWGLRSVCGAWNSIGNINIFMLNLGLADLQYLLTLPFLVAYYAEDSRWRFGEPFCKLTRFCFHLNLYGSIGFLTCVSIYRYLGIVHPMRAMGRLGSRHSLAISALVWFLVVVQILPDAFFDKSDPGRPHACFDTTSDERIGQYLPYSVAWTLTGFAVPLVIIALCYGHVVWVLAQKANVDPALKRRCSKLVLLLVLLFCVCFIPYHVLRNVNLQTRIWKREGICRDSFRGVYVAHQIARCLACLNSALNPLIYIVGNDDFVARFRRVSERTGMSLANATRALLHRRRSEAGPAAAEAACP
ncbi:P2Y purinoceptor 1-like [Phycodurus eques]|uniref:P2Y purinoceptor 1-like n=1 Tax=Phycodurus eques TaxID=693459 RepID=UPI002ACE2C05|nr:P2Y purinoceptor 1-like [Phycodurus eques]